MTGKELIEKLQGRMIDALNKTGVTNADGHYIEDCLTCAIGVVLFKAGYAAKQIFPLLYPRGRAFRKRQRSGFYKRNNPKKNKHMKAYKGFDKALTCRGFQYEEGHEVCRQENYHWCETKIKMDMEKPSIHEPLMVVRIDVSMERYSVVEDVVYYRAKMPMNLALRWRWFFEYIAARVKVKHPRRKVRLSIMQQSEEFKVGADYIADKKTTLLRAKRGQIKKLQNQTENDLFGFAEDERLSKINKLQGEIAALERGEFNYWFPVEYKNHIKQWI